MERLIGCLPENWLTVEDIVCNSTTDDQKRYIAIESIHHVTMLMDRKKFPDKWFDYVLRTHKTKSLCFYGGNVNPGIYALQPGFEIIRGWNTFVETGNISVFIHCLNAWSDIKGGFIPGYLRECAILAMREMQDDYRRCGVEE
jgi:hypothetical protein